MEAKGKTPGRPLKPVVSTERKNFCGAKTRQGGTCRRHPLKGRRRCRLHGGKTPSGTASPHFKTGRYSRYLPTQIRQLYAIHCRDRKSNDLQDEIGLLTVHIGQLLQQAHAKASLDSFSTIQKMTTEIQKAVETNEKDRVVELVAQMKIVIQKGSEGSAIWDKIIDRIETRRRLVDTQRKYDIEMGRMLPVEEAHQFMTTLAIIVKEAHEAHLTDGVLSRAILGQINHKFQSVFGEPVGASPRSEMVH